jgi:hypothetical protein
MLKLGIDLSMYHLLRSICSDIVEVIQQQAPISFPQQPDSAAMPMLVFSLAYSHFNRFGKPKVKFIKHNDHGYGKA